MVPFDKPILFPISVPLQLCVHVAPFTPISQTLKRSRDCKHIPFGVNLLRMQYDIRNTYTKFEVRSFTNSTPQNWVPILGQFLIGSREPDHAHLGVVIPSLAFDIFYQRTKLGDSRFSRSGDKIASFEIENESCDVDHSPLTTPRLSSVR